MLELITILLSSLGKVASDPALGARGAAVKSVLDLAALAIARGSEGADQLRALTEQVKAMAEEGREPTPAEWEDLKLRSDAAHAKIQEWKE